MKQFHNSERAQFITLFAVVIALAIIAGVSVTYIGLAAYEDRKASSEYQENTNNPISVIDNTLTSSMVHANQNPSIDDTSDREGYLTDSFEDQLEIYKQDSNIGLVNYNIRDDDYVKGKRIVKTDFDTNLSNDDNDGNYTVFDSATDTRQLYLNLDKTTIPFRSGTRRPKVNVGIDGGSETLTYTIDNVAGQIYLEQTGIGSSRACYVNTPENTTIDLLRGEVGRIACSDIGAHQYGDVTSVEIENGGTVDGSFSMVTTGVAPSNIGSGIQDNGDSNPSSADDPKAHDVIYGAVVDVKIVTTETAITRPIIITPGDQNTELGSI